MATAAATTRMSATNMIYRLHSHMGAVRCMDALKTIIPITPASATAHAQNTEVVALTTRASVRPNHPLSAQRPSKGPARLTDALPSITRSGLASVTASVPNTAAAAQTTRMCARSSSSSSSRLPRLLHLMSSFITKRGPVLHSGVRPSISRGDLVSATPIAGSMVTAATTLRRCALMCLPQPTERLTLGPQQKQPRQLGPLGGAASAS
mmetsp:Transcript_34063/g.73625  ORF Transcript_34063/g.73625 Transcript_34063/m.73625 type:complete len:208 (-) Transcript_34063:1221-1844(-)